LVGLNQATLFRNFGSDEACETNEFQKNDHETINCFGFIGAQLPEYRRTQTVGIEMIKPAAADFQGETGIEWSPTTALTRQET